MSYTADQNFWKQRVDREIFARNKFIERHFQANKIELSAGKESE